MRSFGLVDVLAPIAFSGGSVSVESGIALLALNVICVVLAWRASSSARGVAWMMGPVLLLDAPAVHQSGVAVDTFVVHVLSALVWGFCAQRSGSLRRASKAS